MDQTNGKLGSMANVEMLDEVESATERDQTTGDLFESQNPVLQPPKPQDVGRKKSWKRKLISWALILLLIVGGLLVLYLLIRVKHVNVLVQADPRRDMQNAKPQTAPANSENALTAEAINLARAATGADANPATVARSSVSPSSSPEPSPASPGVSLDRKVGFTGASPVFEQFNNSPDNVSSTGSTNAQPNNATVAAKTESQSAAEPQSRANPTQSLFIDDVASKPTTLPTTHSVTKPAELKSATTATIKPPATIKPAAVLPPFGTMLPVRTQGVIFTLRNNSYARLELTRDVSGTGWSLPKGTVLVGQTSGSEYDRAFVKVIGYIDPRDNKLVKLNGDVLGSDGAAGIPGRRVGLDRNRLKDTLRKVASSGLQVAGTMAGALTGRGTVVIDGAGYRVLSPLSDEARGLVGGTDKKSFVKVEAGRPAYVMVADLPRSLQAVDAPGEDDVSRAAVSLTDREVMELILFGTPAEIRAALPLMTDDQKQLALKTLGSEAAQP